MRSSLGGLMLRRLWKYVVRGWEDNWWLRKVESVSELTDMAQEQAA